MNVTSNNQKQADGRHSSTSSNGTTDPQPRQPRGVQINDERDLGWIIASAKKAVTQMQTKNTNDSQLSIRLQLSSNHSVAGVYSSSSDPVHVPSPDSRPATNIGAINREVGAVVCVGCLQNLLPKVHQHILILFLIHI